MAKQQGLNSVTVWMIVFVALWLASTVFLVILYTGQEDLANENANLKKAYAAAVTRQQQQSIELIKNAQENGPTMVGLLEDARSATAELATGEPGDAPSAVKAKRDQMLAMIKADGLVTNPDTFVNLSYHDALTSLYETFKAAQNVRKAAEDRAAQLDAQMTEIVQADAALKADFERRIREMSERMSQAEAERVAYRSERDKQIEDLRKQAEESQKRHDAELVRERQVRQASEQQFGEAQKRLNTIQAKVGPMIQRPETLSTARRPDGRILTAVPGDKVVYIDLGRKKALTLGLKFAVYSAQTGIPADGRSKAQIEVSSIFDDSAECKILQVAPNAVIMEGDIVANPIYDPDQPLSFVVAGDFDLDRDGIADPRGHLVIESLIKEWGGRVTDELNPLTDFIVLGGKPRAPRTAGGTDSGQPAPVNPAIERYDKISSQSKSFAIPILTQEVFLNFLGYTDRYVRR